MKVLMKRWNYASGAGFFGLLSLSSCMIIAVSIALSNADSDADEQVRVAKVVKPTTNFSRAEPFELRPGGSATSFDSVNTNSFSQHSANMTFERQLDFKIGNAIFRKAWVSSPASTKSSDGLGPLFNARSCQRCHLKDGRGHPPKADEKAVSMLMRISIPPQSQDDIDALERYLVSSIPEPTYGGQIQNHSVPGVPNEGEVRIQHEEIFVTLADGETVTLQAPSYRIDRLNYGPLHPDTMLSPRVAPPMIGIGLLEAIAQDEILKNADEDDADNDGISGRPNWVWSDEFNRVMLGRFGWKAGQPTVRQQAASAFKGDIGISTTLFPEHHGDCTAMQSSCLTAPHGESGNSDNVEAEDRMFDLLVFYSQNLAVPARRDVDDPRVLRGKRLFYESKCAGCHVPKFVTSRDTPGPEQSFQLIWPYSDMLLHDMGQGLADHRPDGVASGTEWRTAPLWGIGLTEKVNGHTRFLHDGRARNLLEAILWHGGEAEYSRQSVVNMTRQQRTDLLAFLNSL